MIRKYQDFDLEDLIEIWYEASLVTHPFLSKEFLEKEKLNIRKVYTPRANTWIYEDEEGKKGFISMLGNEVGAIFVHPKYFCSGIGTKLIEFAFRLHDTLEVEVFEKNQEGRRFYEKHGFVQVDESIDKSTNEKLLRLKSK